MSKEIIQNGRCYEHIGQVFREIKYPERLEEVIEPKLLEDLQHQNLVVLDVLNLSFEDIANRIEQFYGHLYGYITVVEPKLKESFAQKGEPFFIPSPHPLLNDLEQGLYEIELGEAHVNSFGLDINDKVKYHTHGLILVTNRTTKKSYEGNGITAQLSIANKLFSRMDRDSNVHILTPDSLKEFYEHFIKY